MREGRSPPALFATLAVFLKGEFMRVAIICGALVALTITTAGAEDIDSANYMLPYCKLTYQQAAKSSPTIASMWVRCVRLIEGAWLMLLTRIGGPCVDIPESVTNEQMMRVVTRYREMHPSQTHQRLGLLALDALHEAWPCRP